MNLSLFVLIFFDFSFNLSHSQRTKVFDSEIFTKLAAEPKVCAKAGCLRGKVESGRMKPYEAFYGIPYAEPPVGELRFENPLPHEGWTGYWDATYTRDACMQKNTFIYTQPILGSEDCLYLNIYRPIKWKNDKKLPVMVYIHGGSWICFSGDPTQFGPEFLMDNGEVILVTMNYRLALFGLLCSGDEAVKGNFAFKDQQLAMKWVKENIEYFGGDPNSITLSGESAGGGSVHLHMMNSISQALFHRAIIISGTGISPWGYLKDFKSQFRQAAKFLGIEDWETASTSELTRQLKSIDALSITTAIDDFFIFAITPPVPLTYCLEGDWEGAFLREDPRVIWTEGRYVPKPILIGTTTGEGLFGAVITRNETRLPVMNENIYEYLPIMLSYDPRYTPDVMKYYFGDRDTLDITNERQFFQAITDRWYIYPLNVLVDQFIKAADVQKTPIYIFEFDFKAPFTFLQVLTGLDINLGVCHIDDLLYLFTMSEFLPQFNTISPEGRMVDVFTRTIVNFVARGEVKVWRRFEPCAPSKSTLFCDRQVFKRNEKSDPNEVMVSVTNERDAEMMKLWSKIDNGVDAINQFCN